MGQDGEAQARREALAAYRVDAKLLEKSDEAWFLHCLPARRGEEVTDEVMDGPKSAVWRQASMRSWPIRALAMPWVGQGGAITEANDFAETIECLSDYEIPTLENPEVAVAVLVSPSRACP